MTAESIAKASAGAGTEPVAPPAVLITRTKARTKACVTTEKSKPTERPPAHSGLANSHASASCVNVASTFA